MEGREGGRGWKGERQDESGEGGGGNRRERRDTAYRAHAPCQFEETPPELPYTCYRRDRRRLRSTLSRRRHVARYTRGKRNIALSTRISRHISRRCRTVLRIVSPRCRQHRELRRWCHLASAGWKSRAEI